MSRYRKEADLFGFAVVLGLMVALAGFFIAGLISEAVPQTLTTGRGTGIIPPPPTVPSIGVVRDTANTSPAGYRLVTFPYLFQFDPDATGHGNTIVQSTGSSVSFTCKAPTFSATFNIDNRRARLGESWYTASDSGLVLARKNDYADIVLVFDKWATGGVYGYQIWTMGDTANVFVSPKGVDGYGVFVAGSNQAVTLGDADTWVGFVCNGSDSTYVPLGLASQASGRPDIIRILAEDNGGPVKFYLNGTLAATVSAPARSANRDRFGWSMWFNGDATGVNQTTYNGPFWITRRIY